MDEQEFDMSRILTFLLIFFFAGVAGLGVFAEGTPQIMPDSAKPCRILCSKSTSRDPFALYNGNANYRLFVHVHDSANEKIYFGLGAVSGGGAPTVRVHRPDGSVIFSAASPSSGTGFITFYNQCVVGPSILNPSGYTAFVVTPDLNGDYFITFEYSGSQEREFDYFDISVVNVPTLTRINGRVFSKSWQFRNTQYSNFPPQWWPFIGQIFPYTNDGIVTKFNPNGFDGRDFSITCNESGCYQITPLMPANEARKSAEGRHTYPQFKIFVNNPDEAVYPSGTLGSLVNNTPVVQTLIDCNTGTIRFVFEVTAPGTGEVNLQISSLGPQYTDRLLSQNVAGGWDTIVWDGYDGSIPPKLVPNNSSFPFVLTYINGMTHLPLYDVENNENGFIVTLIRPAGPEPNFYWDDTELSPAMTPGPSLSPPGGCTSSATPCHLWSGGDPGNNRSVNTWWYIANVSTAPVVVIEIRKPPAPGPINGPLQVCPGSTGNIYWINTEPSSTGYVWGYTGIGATFTPVNDTTVSVAFANNATSGNLTVSGTNIECGPGLEQSLAITLKPSPVVGLAAFAPVCFDTPAFLLTGGSPAGGTYWIGGMPVITFDPAVAGLGSHDVTYIYTDPVTSCTASEVKPIVVNPLPVVTLAPLSSVCINIPAYILSGGLPAGGVFSGPGVSAGDLFTPSAAGAGTHNIIYTYTDINSCVNTDTKPLVVFPLTTVTLAAQPAACINAAPYPLTGGVPAGGIYSGPGVTAGIFDPAAAGVGIHTIIYTHTDANSCVNSDSKSLTVNPLPGAPGTITGASTLCQASMSVPYNTSVIANAVSYLWAVNPTAAGTIIGNSSSVLINWSALYSGPAQITVKGVNGCGDGAISVPLNVTLNPKPEVTLSRCIDSVTSTVAKPITLKGGIPLGGNYTGAGVNTAQGILYPSLAGSGSHTLTYTYTNAYGCISAATSTFLIQNPTPWNCGSLLTDIRDSKQYPTILIGTQCWMAANLDYGRAVTSTFVQRDNCVVEKYCFNDTPANCTAGGGLYQWDEAMVYASAPGIQGLCPPGWHIPTDTEWTLLFSNFINNGFAGSPLKATGYSGFDALVTGVSFFNRSWSFNNFASLFWTSTAHSPYKAWAHGMNSFNPSVSLYPAARANAFSIRCLKD
jgi:uncharacterized protein (TIGR02145 family)